MVTVGGLSLVYLMKAECQRLVRVSYAGQRMAKEVSDKLVVYDTDGAKEVLAVFRGS